MVWVLQLRPCLHVLVVVSIQKLLMLELTLLVKLKLVFLKMIHETLQLLLIMLVIMLVMLPVWVLTFMNHMLDQFLQLLHLELLFHAGKWCWHQSDRLAVVAPMIVAAIGIFLSIVGILW